MRARRGASLMRACRGASLHGRFEWRYRVMRLALLVMIAAACLVGSPGAEWGVAVAGEGKPSPIVIKVWRQLFSRPTEIPAPADNPQTSSKIALGSALFHDTRLSGDGQRSCASCHRSDKGFSDGRIKGAGLAGDNLKRNTPSLYNLAWGTHFYWDGREPSLEAQARVPIQHPNEMNGTFDVIVDRLRADRSMMRKFATAFPGIAQLSGDHIVKALAAYERSLVSPITRFDRWVADDDAALSAAEFAGFRLFVGKAGCVGCHVGWRFTDDKFHNIGLPGKDPGRGAIPGGVPGLASFKTPGLREAVYSAPFMHDGSLATLEAVISHYAGGFDKQRNLSSNMVRDLALSSVEKAQLLAFLKTLSQVGR